ncbi:pentapeptide repeat-containing protein [Saccharothrix stipae]
MTYGTDPPAPRPRVHLRPLRWWWVAAAAGCVVLSGALVGWWLWPDLAGLTDVERERARTEAVRTGLTTAAGAGAALALLLAVRRQRALEVALDLQEEDLRKKDRDLAQKEEANARTWHDAEERRVTELYTKAADQLGSDRAPVRLAGMYALERLAQGNRSQRQTIVNVLCAYLRMPFQGEYAGADTAERERHRQERLVRSTALEIVLSHLRPRPGHEFWPDVDLDLSGAELFELDVTDCEVRSADFRRATFHGDVIIMDSTFAGGVDFSGARFEGSLRCIGGRFGARVAFGSATFAGEVTCGLVDLRAGVDFSGARFADSARFLTLSFPSPTSFHDSRFDAEFALSDVVFENDAPFTGAVFAGAITVEEVKARIYGPPRTNPDGTAQGWPPGCVARSPEPGAWSRIEHSG